MKVPFIRQYREFQNHASANWPFLWRARLDIPILFGTLAIALAILSPYLVKALPLLGLPPIVFLIVFKYFLVVLLFVILVICGFAAGFWLYVTSRALPLKEIPQYANSPRFILILLGLIYLALAPFISTFRLLWTFDNRNVSIMSAFSMPEYKPFIGFFIIYVTLVVFVAGFAKIARLTSLGKTLKALGLIAASVGIIVVLATIAEMITPADSVKINGMVIGTPDQFGSLGAWLLLLLLSAPVLLTGWIFRGRYKGKQFELLINYIFWWLPYSIFSLIGVIIVAVTKVGEWTGVQNPFEDAGTTSVGLSETTVGILVASGIAIFFIVVFEVYFFIYSKSSLRPQR